MRCKKDLPSEKRHPTKRMEERRQKDYKNEPDNSEQRVDAANEKV